MSPFTKTISPSLTSDSVLSTFGSNLQVTGLNSDHSSDNVAPRREFNPQRFPARTKLPKCRRMVRTLDRSTRIQIRKEYIKEARQRQREKKNEPSQPVFSTSSAVFENDNSDEFPMTARPPPYREGGARPLTTLPKTEKEPVQHKRVRHQPYWKFEDYLPLSVVESSSEED